MNWAQVCVRGLTLLLRMMPKEEVEEEEEEEGLTDNGPQDILPHLGGLWLGVCFWK